MSATEQKFSGREIVELISETKMGDFGLFMADAVRAGFSREEVRVGVESNIAAIMVMFLDSHPVEAQDRLCAEMMDGVRDWTISWMQRARAQDRDLDKGAA